MFVFVQVRLHQLTKQQERLLKESEATVTRRETIVLHKEAIVHNLQKQKTKGELRRFIQGLQHKIQEKHKVGQVNFPYLQVHLGQVVQLSFIKFVCVCSGCGREWAGDQGAPEEPVESEKQACAAEAEVDRSLWHQLHPWLWVCKPTGHQRWGKKHMQYISRTIVLDLSTHK